MTITSNLPSAASALPDFKNDILRITDTDYPSSGGKEYKITLANLASAMYIPLPLIISLIMSLPALRGFWPGSSQAAPTSGNYNLVDVSGNGQNFIHNNNPRIRINATRLFPFIDFNGTNEWYSIGDTAHWDILSNPTSVS